MRLHRFALGAALALSPVLASAAPISGTLAVAGTDSFTSTSLTFHSPGIVVGDSGTFTSAVTPFATLAILTSTPITASTTSTPIFTTSNNAVSFSINSVSEFLSGVDSQGSPTLTIDGVGTFTETGYDATTANFSLTSSNTGMTSFQFNGGTAPEISASGAAEGIVLLLGGGLILRRGKLFGSEASEVL